MFNMTTNHPFIQKRIMIMMMMCCMMSFIPTIFVTSFSVITTTTTRSSSSSSSSSIIVQRLQRQQQQRQQQQQQHVQLQLAPNELWDSYTSALETDPLLVKSITAGIILGAADLAGQVFESNQNSQQDDTTETDMNSFTIDIGRMVRFSFFGFILQAPWNHYYYMILDGQIPPTPTEPFSNTNLLKIGIDQFIQAPIFTVIIFLFLGIAEGKTIETIQKQLKNDYQSTIIANWKLWVPATILNIAFVPPLLRVLYLNCVFFFWSIYLSLVVNKKE